MSAIGARVAVNDAAAVEVVKAGRVARIKNTGASAALLGGPGVTSATGFSLAANETIELDCRVDAVHAICAAAQTATLHVLAVRSAD